MTAIVRKLHTLDTKKTLLVVLTAGLLAFILSFTLVSASGPEFNKFPISFTPKENHDLPLMDIRNATKGTDWSRASRIISADRGDIIEVSMYYHNGTENKEENIARDTMLHSFVRNGRLGSASESFTLGGQLWADNAAKVIARQKGGEVTVNINGGPAALSLVPGSVVNTREDGPTRSLPDTIFDGGVNVGDVRGCWEFIGFVNFQLKVEGEAVQEQPGKLKIEKFVKNVTKGTSLQDNEVTAEPGDQISYRINIMADGNHVDNVVVKDKIDSLLRGNVFDVTLDSQPVSSTFVQNFFADGASIGTVKKAGSTKIRFRTRVPDRSAFKPGSHLLDNKAVAFTETDRSTDHAGVRVNIDSPPPPPPPEGEVRVQKLVGNVTKNIDVTDVSVNADIGDTIKYNIILRADNKVNNVVVLDVIDSRLRPGVFTANLDGNTLTQAQINQLFGSGLNVGSVGDPGNRVRHIRFRTVVPDLPVGRHNLDNVAIVKDQRDNAVVMVVVQGPPPPPPPPSQPRCNMSVFPNQIQKGQSATLSWTSQNVTRVFINQGVGNVAPNGSTQVSPNQNTTFTGTFSGPGGSVNCSAELTVIIPPPPPPSQPRCTINVSPASIQRGNSAVLFWTSQNAGFARINQGIGSVPVNGSRVVLPLETITFTMTVTGTDGRTANCQTTLTVTDVPPPPPPPSQPSCTITVTPNVIQRGQTATLSWTSQNAVSAQINQGIGFVSLSGERSVSPSQTTTFVMTVTGQDGRTNTCSSTLTVFSEPTVQDLFVSKEVQNISQDTGFANTVTASAGNTVRFRITMTATGNTTQTNIRARDSFPSGLNFVTGTLRIDGSTFSPEPALFNNGINLGSLSAGGSRTVSFDATVLSATGFATFTNTAFARSDQVTEKNDSAQVTVQVAGVQFQQRKEAFNLTKGVDATTVAAEPGDIITYNLVFRNTGSSAMSNVVIEDDISDILELAAVVNQGDAREITGGIIRWDPVNIQAGGQVIRTFQVKVKPRAEFPANTDLLMVNFFGNEVRVLVSGVKGVTAPPRTGAGEWMVGILAGLSTAGYWAYRKRPELLTNLKLNIKSLITSH